MKVSLSITLPMKVANALQAYAIAHKLTISAAVAKLLALALAEVESK